MANVVNENSYLDITVETSSGTEAIVEGVVSGAWGIGNLSAASVTRPYKGVGPYEGTPHKEIRGIIGMGMQDINYIARPDKDIKTISDLKDHTVAVFSGAAYVFYNPLLETYGLKPGVDYKEILMEGDEVAWDELIMGRIDAMPSYSVSNLLKAQEALGSVTILPLDRDKVLQAKEEHPDQFVGLVPGILTPEYCNSIGFNLPNPVPVIMSPRLMFTTKDLPDEISYTITKTVIDHYKEYKEIIAPEYTPDLSVWSPEVTWHPGSIKAFKELGMWTDEMEKAQIRLLAQE